MSIFDTRHEECDEDEDDSLFGSPPPSPGRPASPALALPSSGYSGSSMSTAPTQNVGTIALPGSHPNSELPINPLALSLNHGVVHRPQALPHQMQYPLLLQSQVPVTSASLVRGGAPPQVHAWNASASASPLQKKPKKRVRPPSPPIAPAGPEFALPDPTAPPPTHFLRNQENLLGRAGRIAGIKPANLTHTRGSTPSNPILVDDEDDRPTLGRRVQSSEKTQPYIDPALLTAPTNQEIVSVLIGQKDIFPILEGVLKLVVGNTPDTRPKTGFEHTTTQDESSSSSLQPSSSNQPSNNNSHTVKKRKLNRVPAGATDWDVPYPFPQGEGPEAYHKTWERERGKQLISQLIQLIKSAARKAATKKYLAQQKSNEEAGSNAKSKARRLPKDNSETAQNTIQETQSRQPSCEVLQDTSNAPSTSRNTIPTSNSATSQIPSTSATQTHPSSEMEVTFQQLMFSLDNIPDQGHPQTTGQDEGSMSKTQDFFVPQNTSDVSGSTGTSLTPTSSTGSDQPLFDTWMHFLESFPMGFVGAPNGHLNSNISASTLVQTSVMPSQCSTPGSQLDDFNFANMLGAEMAGAGTGALSTANSDFDAMLTSMFQQQPPQPGDVVSSQFTASGDLSAPSTFEDHLIDPNLLALGIQGQAAWMDSPIMNLSMDLIPHAISPFASGSSVGGSTNPGTPASAGWEMSMPDVFIAGAEGGGDEQGMWRSTIWDLIAIAYEGIGNIAWTNVGGGSSGEAMMDFGILPELIEDMEPLDGSRNANAKGKGKERETDPALMPSVVSPSPTVSMPTSMPTRASIPPQASFLLGSQPQTAPPRRSYNALTSTKPFTEALPKTLSRQLRRDDILKRAENQKRLIQKELDVVKTRLWETTIEQAGLVTLQKRLAQKTDAARAGEVPGTGVMPL